MPYVLAQPSEYLLTCRRLGGTIKYQGSERIRRIAHSTVVCIVRG
jgi:hypothetical protein